MSDVSDRTCPHPPCRPEISGNTAGKSNPRLEVSQYGNMFLGTETRCVFRTRCLMERRVPPVEPASNCSPEGAQMHRAMISLPTSPARKASKTIWTPKKKPGGAKASTRSLVVMLAPTRTSRPNPIAQTSTIWNWANFGVKWRTPSGSEMPSDFTAETQ